MQNIHSTSYFVNEKHFEHAFPTSPPPAPSIPRLEMKTESHVRDISVDECTLALWKAPHVSSDK